jgi:hypothetical protein
MEDHNVLREVVQVIVTIERPSASELQKLNRPERIRALRANTSRRRDDLIAWIEQEGLFEQVEKVGKATAFNLLFLRSTREVAERIKEAPGVAKVAVAEDLSR